MVSERPTNGKQRHYSGNDQKQNCMHIPQWLQAYITLAHVMPAPVIAASVVSIVRSEDTIQQILRQDQVEAEAL